ncbi:MAG: TraR/DksA family transcriptional regulator [Alkalilacustris sp.]
MTTIAERRQQLEARRRELLARMQEVEAELASHTTKDWEDAAVEQEQDEVLEGIGHAALDEVARIDAALARILTEDYGICARCGTEISAERLDAVPYTPFCRDCAA